MVAYTVDLVLLLCVTLCIPLSMLASLIPVIRVDEIIIVTAEVICSIISLVRSRTVLPEACTCLAVGITMVFMLLLVRKTNRMKATLPVLLIAHCIYTLSTRVEFKFITLLSMFHIGWIIVTSSGLPASSTLFALPGLRSLRSLRVYDDKNNKMQTNKQHWE